MVGGDGDGMGVINLHTLYFPRIEFSLLGLCLCQGEIGLGLISGKGRLLLYRDTDWGLYLEIFRFILSTTYMYVLCIIKHVIL